MKVLLFSTGGTIGSVLKGDQIDVASGGTMITLTANYPEIEFEFQSPLNILSECITASDFNTLAKALYEEDFSNYDGVIITSGSDNLGYISAFIGLLFGDCGVPVCIVGADKMLSDPTTNGYANFACAIELIRQGRKGVFVPYRNADGVNYVHSATDLRQADYSANFYSYNGAYGVFDPVGSVLRKHHPYVARCLPAVFSKNHLPQLSDNVLLLHAYPMQDYKRISTDGVKAVLHMLYHSATLDADAASAFVRSCKAPVFLASFRTGRKMYRTTADVIKAGAVMLFDIAPECAYMKLLLACAQDEMSVTEFMER